MSKLLDLNKNVQELCTQYPELVGIMADLGFKDITRPITLATIGKVMTIPKGAAIKKIAMQDIVQILRQHGFEIADAETERKLLLKSYVSRLTEGEKLETVREDFVKNFADISALEIVQAEQELLDAQAAHTLAFIAVYKALGGAPLATATNTTAAELKKGAR